MQFSEELEFFFFFFSLCFRVANIEAAWVATLDKSARNNLQRGKKIVDIKTNFKRFKIEIDV